jgi:hypothetical protein
MRGAERLLVNPVGLAKKMYFYGETFYEIHQAEAI